MNARFSSMVPNASSVAARRMYGDFGAPLPLVVVVVVSDIDSLTKHSFCDLPEDYRCWLDWPGRPKPSLLLAGAPLPFRSAPRITAVQAARAIWGTAGATKWTARRTICRTLVLAGIVFRCSRMKGHPGHWPRSAGPCTALHAPGSRLPLPRHARRALPQSLTIVPSQPLARFRGFLHPRILFRRKIRKQEFFSRALIHSPCSHRRIELHDVGIRCDPESDLFLHSGRQHMPPRYEPAAPAGRNFARNNIRMFRQILAYRSCRLFVYDIHQDL